MTGARMRRRKCVEETVWFMHDALMLFFWSQPSFLSIISVEMCRGHTVDDIIDGSPRIS